MFHNFYIPSPYKKLAKTLLTLPLDFNPFASMGQKVFKSISIKDFVREKKSATEKRKSNRNFLLMKLNTKPLKFKYRLAGGGGGGAGWSTHARHGYPHLVFHN
jgi:hypothetical protein